MIEQLPIAEIVGITTLVPIVGMALSRAKRLTIPETRSATATKANSRKPSK